MNSLMPKPLVGLVVALFAAIPALPPAAAQEPQEITAAVPEYWPPQYDTDDDGHPTGFAIDVMEAVAAKSGFKILYRVYPNFPAVFEAVRQGRAELIPNLGITPGRQAEYLFTAPVQTFAVSIFVRDETRDINGIEELSGRDVAVVRKNVGEKILSNLEDVNGVVFDDARSALFELLAGQVDAMIFPKPVLIHMARGARIADRIKMVGEPLREVRRAIGVRKEHEAIWRKLEPAVNAFVGSPEYERIYVKWYGEPMPFWSVERAVSTMATVFVVILFAMVWWRQRSLLNVNTDLARTVEEKERISQALSEQEKQLRLITDSVPALILYLDSERRYQFANHTAESWFARSQDEIIGRRPDEILSESAYQAVSPLFEAVAQKRESRSEMTLTYPDGKTRTVEATVVPDIDGAGNIIGNFSMVIDISARRKAEAALRENEQLLRAILDNSPSGIQLKDTEGQFLIVNKRLAEWFEKKPEDMIGRRTADFLTGKALEQTLAHDVEVIDGEKPVVKELTRTFPDGKRHTTITQKFPVYGAEHEVVGTGAINTDISDVKALQETLRETEERFRKIVENINVIVWEADPETLQFTYVSPHAEMVLGYPADEWLDEGFIANRVHPDDLDVTLSGCGLVASVGKDITYEFRIIGQDGAIVWLRNFVSAIREGDRTVTLSGFMVDVTARVEAERDRELALVRAEEANQAKSEFLATMSHELRTPLNAILGFSDLIGSQTLGPLNESYIEYIKDIRNSGQLLMDLVNDILDISTIEAGKHELEMEPVAMAGVISECARVVSGFARDKEIDLQAEEADPDVVVVGDRRALRQILLNLLSNAVKYTGPGGAVHVSSSVVANRGVLSVVDTGSGIPEEKLDALTEPFVRLNTDPYLSHEGAGLGLAITKPLVELQDGGLEMESAVGEGTTVRISMPLSADRSAVTN